MSCRELLRTQAFLDGELDGAAAAEAERHIEHCPECRKFAADAAQLSDALQRQLPRHPAPPALRARVDAALKERSSAPILPFRGRGFWWGAASGIGLSALAAGFAILAILPPSAGTLAQAVTAAHTSALMGGRVIEVASSNHHTLKPWFAGRAPVSPPVADFAREGFALVGGRVDEIAGTPAAVLVYRHGHHTIDLFVWADTGARLPKDSMTHGYRALFWKRGDLDFAEVSDMGQAETRQFAQLAKQAPE